MTRDEALYAVKVNYPSEYDSLRKALYTNKVTEVSDDTYAKIVAICERKHPIYADRENYRWEGDEYKYGC